MSDEITLSNKRDIDEIRNIINFSSKIEIKDYLLAESTETLESSSNGYKLISCILKSDSLKDYNVVMSDIKLINNTVNSVDDLNEQELEELLSLKRFQFFKWYIENGDLNPYYENIYVNTAKFEEPIFTNYKEFEESNHVPFYVSARLAEDLDIIYIPISGELNKNETGLYKKSINEASLYFKRVLYNKAFKLNNPKYTGFAKTMIILIAIMRFIDVKYENNFDVDLLDSYCLRNLLVSNGLDYFDRMPIPYQRRLAKNINALLNKKGSNQCLIDVVKLFGFDNINIFKYFLVKDRTFDKDKMEFGSPSLSFVKMDHLEKNISKALYDSPKFEYDTFVDDDPTWDLEVKDELLEYKFNYIATKYLSIETVMELMKQTNEFNYFYSVMLKKRLQNLDFNINLIIPTISDKSIDLFLLIESLKFLVFKKLGYKDKIVATSEDANRLTYGFNFDVVKEKTFSYIMDYEGTKKEVFTPELREYLINKYFLDSDVPLTTKLVCDLFLTNSKYRERICDDIQKETDRKKYKILYEFYKVAFLTKYNKEIYAKKENEEEFHTTYEDFIRENNSNLMDYLLADIEQEGNLENKVLLISQSIEDYLNNEEINFFTKNSNLSFDFIKEFILQLLNLLKSYTVMIKSFDVSYIFDDKFFSKIKLFDEIKLSNNIRYNDCIPLDDKFKNKIHITKNESFNFSDSFKLIIKE